MMLVEWDDSASSNRWESKEEVSHIAPCVTCGILLREDDKEVEMCCTLGEENKLHSMSIPRGAIRRMRQLCLK